MKQTIFILLLISGFAAVGQQNTYPVEPVVREKIKKMVTDSSLKTYYPQILERFKRDDTTLNLVDHRALYYGFVFNENYYAYPDFQGGRIQNALKEKDYTSALKICDSILEKIPVSLVANYYKCVALLRINENDSSYIVYRTRYTNLLRAVLSSGDGLACETAFKIIFVTDEYQVMYQFFEVDFLGQALEFPCDRMRIKPSKYFNADNIYFNTAETFLYMKEKLGKD